MKKFFFILLVAFLSIATTSCSSNDEPEAPMENLSEFMIGKWYIAQNPELEYLDNVEIISFDADGFGYDISKNSVHSDTFKWWTNGNLLFFTYDYKYGTYDPYEDDFFCAEIVKGNDNIITVHYKELTYFKSPTDYKITPGKEMGTQNWYRR